jgi:small subunit ribosomal protein S2
LSGIANLDRVPDAIFVIDTKKEHIAVTEARKLGLPVVAVVDTNCDPDVIDFVIPGNDDAIRSGALLCRLIADAVTEGRFIRANRPVISKAAPAPAPAAEVTPAPTAEVAPAPAAEVTPAPTAEVAPVPAAEVKPAPAAEVAPAPATEVTPVVEIETTPAPTAEVAPAAASDAEATTEIAKA